MFGSNQTPGNEDPILRVDFNKIALGMQQLADNLDHLAGSTEGDFLAIGTNIKDFYKRAGEISKASSSVTCLMSGENITEAMEDLHCMLERTELDLISREQDSEQGTYNLKSIRSTIENIQDSLGEFKSIIRMLIMLGTNTRIESAYLTNDIDGFQNLADDVEKLTEVMGSKFVSMLKQLRILNDLIMHTLTNLTNVEKEQNVKRKKILKEMENSLSVLMNQHDLSLDTAKETEVESENISASISNIVSAMQFHDITRQQMEHIRDALKEKSRISANIFEAQDADIEIRKKFIFMISDITKLQASQLLHTKDDFWTAVDNIIKNLDDVSKSILEMTGKIAEMTGADGGSGELSCLSDIEKGMAEILDSLAANAVVEAEISNVVSSLTKTVSGLTLFIDSVEEIGVEIGRVAVNACIKAAHTGKEGAALGVLSESIQRLATDARFQTSAISDHLKGISTIAENLNTSTNLTIESRRAADSEMVKEIDSLLGSMRSVNNKVSSILASGKMDSMARSLAKDISSMLHSIDVHHKVVSKMDNLIVKLQHLWTLPEKLNISRDKSDTSMLSFEELKNRYTMQSERDIHCANEASGAVLDNHASVAGNAGEISSTDAEDDFGNNVDFF